MKTAAVYARYSSSNQTEQSIEGQLRVCREYAERNGIVIVKTYIDRAMTGTNDNREAFQQMLKDSGKKQWELLLVYKLDRFSRNKYEMAIHRKHLKDNGVKILSAMENIPDSPEGVLLESLLEGMNQYYSEELSQKVRRGLRESRIKGNAICNRVPYGWDKVNKKYVINEHEAEIVKEIFRTYLSGRTMEQIASDLRARGIINKDRPFKENVIYTMLHNEKYTGIYRIHDQVYDNIFPPIITQEIFEQTQKRLALTATGKHVPDVTYLLRGKIIYGHCGKRYVAWTGYRPLQAYAQILPLRQRQGAFLQEHPQRDIGKRCRAGVKGNRRHQRKNRAACGRCSQTQETGSRTKYRTETYGERTVTDGEVHCRHYEGDRDGRRDRNDESTFGGIGTAETETGREDRHSQSKPPRRHNEGDDRRIYP